MDGENNGKPYYNGWFFGVPLFLETTNIPRESEKHWSDQFNAISQIEAVIVTLLIGDLRIIYIY